MTLKLENWRIELLDRWSALLTAQVVCPGSQRDPPQVHFMFLRILQSYLITAKIWLKGSWKSSTLSIVLHQNCHLWITENSTTEPGATLAVVLKIILVSLWMWTLHVSSFAMLHATGALRLRGSSFSIWASTGLVLPRGKLLPARWWDPKEIMRSNEILHAISPSLKTSFRTELQCYLLPLSYYSGSREDSQNPFRLPAGSVQLSHPICISMYPDVLPSHQLKACDWRWLSDVLVENTSVGE